MWQGDMVLFSLHGKYYGQLIYQSVVASIKMVWRHFGQWKDCNNMKRTFAFMIIDSEMCLWVAFFRAGTYLF